MIPTMPHALLPEQVRILRDVQNFSTLARYHGLLPMKYARLYDKDFLRDLLDGQLLEKGTVLAPCGNRLSGYRLTQNAQRALAQMGDSTLERQPAAPRPAVGDEELDAADIAALGDVLHLSQVSRHAGLCPRGELVDMHGKAVVKRLYDLGLILYIKMKGVSDKSRKGYVLSQLGRRFLKEPGAQTCQP